MLILTPKVILEIRMTSLMLLCLLFGAIIVNLLLVMPVLVHITTILMLNVLVLRRELIYC